MLIRPIKYRDLDGVERTDNFHFNLSVSEVSELEVDMPGGLGEHMYKIIEDRDAKAMLAIYKRVIILAYGERTADGRYFLKENEAGYTLGRLFLQHPAYDALFLEMFGPDASDEAFGLFIRGCMPKELVDKMPSDNDMPKTIEEIRAQKRQQLQNQTEPEKKGADAYTRQQLLDMSQEEFDEVAGTDPIKMTPVALQVAYQRKSQENAEG